MKPTLNMSRGLATLLYVVVTLFPIITGVNMLMGFEIIQSFPRSFGFWS